MRVVALVSGGKDSCYSIMKCVEAGHEVVALANIQPREADELDSYMFQSVGHEGVKHFAAAMELPLYQRFTWGKAVSCDLSYRPEEGDEVEDLYELVRGVKVERGVEGVASGAVLSNYQRLRVENVCERLGLKSLAYLWQRDQTELLQEMVEAGVSAVLIKVASIDLTQLHLGKSIKEMIPELQESYERYGTNVCGEGGEYETFTLDCPLFKKRIEIVRSQVCVHSSGLIAPVAYLLLKELKLTDKDVLQEKPVLPASVPTATTSCKPAWFPGGLTRISLEPSPQICKKGSAYMWMVFDGDGSSTKSAADQTRQIFSMIEAGLTQHDHSWDEVSLVYLYLAEMADFPAVNAVYSSFFSSIPPARVCVELSLSEGVLVRVEVMVCGCEAGEAGGRTSMHVQSISHWAPANIGPYSQAVAVNKVLFLAGQIGLDPGSMSLVCAEKQAPLSLQHARAVLLANGAAFGSVLSVVCYYCGQEAGWRAKTAWRECVSSERTTGCPPVVFLPVPAMPRGALVEWHLCAVESQQDSDVKFSSHDCVEGGVVVSQKEAWSADLQVGCWTVVISPTQDGVGFPSLIQVIESALDRISGLLSSHDLLLTDLSLLRLCAPKYGDREFPILITDLCSHCRVKANDLPLSLLTTEGYHGLENGSVSIQACKFHRTRVAPSSTDSDY